MTSGLPLPLCGSSPAEITSALFPSGWETTTDTTDAPESLFISARGSWGAWGAGVLYGWTQSGTRPKFELVAGSSTGALLGGFAILAEKGAPPTSFDAKMKDAYTKSKNDDIYKKHSVFSMMFSNSINSLAPLRTAREPGPHGRGPQWRSALDGPAGRRAHDAGLGEDPGLARFAGVIDGADLDAMSDASDAACEQVNLGEWSLPSRHEHRHLAVPRRALHSCELSRAGGRGCMRV